MTFGLSRLLTLCVLTFLIFGQNLNAQTVRPHDDEDDGYEFRISRNSGTGYFGAVVDAASGDGSSEESPFKTYIALNDPSSTNPNQNIYFSQIGVTLPSIDTSSSPSGINAFMKFDAIVDNKTNDGVEVYAAVEADDSDSYFFFPLSKSPTTVGANSEDVVVSLTLDFEQICDNHDTCSTDFREDVDGQKKKAFKVYFFASDKNFSPGSTIDESGSESGGFYYELNFSDKVPNNYLKPYDVRKGDGRLVLDYEDSLGVTEMADDDLYKTLIYDYLQNGGVASSQSADQEVGSGLAGGIHSFKDPKREGEVTVKDLENGKTYNFAAALVNKYQFASPLSTSLPETPESIQTLLEKQACFLLTAGFGEEHPTIRYFQGIRDKWLVHSAWGRVFIKVYYEYGPVLAQSVYSSDLARSGIRLSANIFKYVFFAIPLFLGLGLLGGIAQLIFYRSLTDGLFRRRRRSP